VKTLFKLAVALVIVLLIAVVAWRLSKSSTAEDAEEKVEVTAMVKTAPLVRKNITATTIAYGSVVAQAGKVQTISAAFETRVDHILVAPGQPVKKGDLLVQFAPSPAAQLTLSQAQSASDEASKELKQTQQRFDLKLATNAEMNLAMKAARDAVAQLESLQREGIADGGLRALEDGIVATVSSQDGQIVAAGGTLLEIVNSSAIETKLGVEPEDASTLRVGQSVALLPVNQPTQKAVMGSVRLVTQKIDPSTRLVDVYVTMPGGSGLFLGGYVKVMIELSHADALVAPRSAVLPGEDGWQVFTIADGKAVLHAVKIGILNDNEAEVLDSNLKSGDAVVTVGNYELEEGMAAEAGK